ncbi:MAG: hypothetical protein J2P26_03965 [Nocardiopsaceae bacterium]|nr:hypothetical protein [Nocardiopsaceae bacterium]
MSEEGVQRMSQDYSERKFNYLFDWFDHTRNGYLTREDFEQLADVFAAQAPDHDQRNRTAILEAFLRWWHVLVEAGGADSEQRISREKFQAIMRSHIIQDEHFELIIFGIIDSLMDALDDGSGKLTKEQYVGMYDALGIPPEISTPAFGKLDRDQDGAISHAEFRIAIDEFYRSTDPEAGGHWLLGTPHEHAA